MRANRIVDDLLLARRAVAVAWTDDPKQPPGARFRPEQLRPGTVVRVPTDSQLASATVATRRAAAATPVPVRTAVRDPGARADTPVPGANERDGSRRIAMAPPVVDRDSPTGSCDVTADRDFRVAVEDIANVAALEIRLAAANSQMQEIWERDGTRYVPSAVAVERSGVFADADADAVLLVGYHKFGGWGLACFRVKYALHLLDRRSGLVMTERADSSNLRARMRELIGTWAGS